MLVIKALRSFRLGISTIRPTMIALTWGFGVTLSRCSRLLAPAGSPFSQALRVLLPSRPEVAELPGRVTAQGLPLALAARLSGCQAGLAAALACQAALFLSRFRGAAPYRRRAPPPRRRTTTGLIADYGPYVRTCMSCNSEYHPNIDLWYPSKAGGKLSVS